MDSDNPVGLNGYIEVLETSLEEKAQKEMLPLQPGDVPGTFADVEALIANLGYKPETNVKDGIERFVVWFRGYYEIDE